MNQNIAYFPQANIDHRQGNNNSQNTIPFHEFPGGFHTSNTNSFHTNSATFSSQNQHGLAQNAATLTNQRIATTAVPVSVSGSGQQPATVHVQLVPQGSSPVTSQQHIIIATQPLGQNAGGSAGNATGNEPEDRRMAAFMEYFVEQQPVCSTVQQNSAIQYQTPALNTKYTIKNKLGACIDKSERDLLKRAKQAEAARQRYHRLTPDEKKDLNLKRTLAQKRKRQREKELSELEQILRMTNDIVDDPEVTEQLREKRMRARWAEAARTRYQRMSSEERRHHNTKRRVRQTKGEKIEGDDDASRMRMREQNTKKAEAARLRYHRMSAEEKKIYNQRRTEAFRRRRMEEEALLAMPIGRINGEALDRAQQIVVRNAKRAEAARLRYQRMTPEQRKMYNQKRYTPKRKREPQDNAMSDGSGERPTKVKQQHEYDALSSLERDVIRRTQQAQQSLLRQRQQQQPGVGVVGSPPGVAGIPIASNSPYNNATTLGSSLSGLGVGQTLGNALAAQQNQLHQNQQQQTLSGLQLGGASVANTIRHQIQQQQQHQQQQQQQHPIQLQYTTGGMVQHQLQQGQQQPQLITTYATQQHPN